MTKKSVLGKGIGALLNTSIATPRNFEVKEQAPQKVVEKKVELKDTYGSVIMVSIDQIIPNEDQPRRVFKLEELEDLSNSIKLNGIIQPITVTKSQDSKKFEIIAGERRYRAAKLAGLKEVPVINKRVTKKEKLAFAIIENVQRSDLNCVEEGLAYFKLMDEFSLTQDEVAKRVGKNRSTVANFLRILRLPKEVIMYLQKEQLSFGHAKVLASIQDDNKVIKVAKLAVEEGFSVKQLTFALKSKEADAPKKKKKSSSSNEGYSLLQEKLERTTGYQFNIKSNKKNVGKIEIKFNSLEEFNNIYKYLLD